MEQEVKQEATQVSWNLSALLIQEIGTHLSNSSNYFAANLFYKSYRELVVVEMRISTYFTQDEKDELKKHSNYLDNGSSIFQVLPNGATEKDILIQLKQQQRYYSELRNYNDLIMNALKKYGFLIKPAEDSKRMF